MVALSKMYFWSFGAAVGKYQPGLLRHRVVLPKQPAHHLVLVLDDAVAAVRTRSPGLGPLSIDWRSKDRNLTPVYWYCSQALCAAQCWSQLVSQLDAQVPMCCTVTLGGALLAEEPAVVCGGRVQVRWVSMSEVLSE